MSYEIFSYVDEEKKQLSYWEGSEHTSKINIIKILKTNKNCDNLSVAKSKTATHYQLTYFHFSLEVLFLFCSLIVNFLKVFIISSHWCEDFFIFIWDKKTSLYSLIRSAALSNFCIDSYVLYFDSYSFQCTRYCVVKVTF